MMPVTCLWGSVLSRVDVFTMQLLAKRMAKKMSKKDRGINAD
jgi:hypothetical protein